MNRELLEKKFDVSQIRQRKGNFGKMLDYIEGHAVIQRLNDAFDGGWSFHIVSHEILENEVIVCGALTAEDITKQQYGSSQITRNSQDNSIISLGDDLKSATTDALKKCATLLGVGLHLYGEKETVQDTGQRNHTASPKGNGSNGGNGSGSTDKATNSQIKLITELANKQRISNKALASMINEIGAVTAVEHLTKRSASEVIQNLMAA